MTNKITSLQHFIEYIHIMKTATPVQLSIAVCDTEKFLAYMPGIDIDLHIRKGQYLQPDEPLSEALRNNQRLEAIVPAHFYGFEFVGTATPLHNEQGAIIGGIAVQVRKPRELIDVSTVLDTSLLQVHDQLHDISNSANTLTNMTTMLHAESTDAAKNIKQSEQMLQVIQQMTNQTNVLGLNASIEAARAGKYGQGFHVVAKEIQRFAQQSAQSTKDIQQTIQQLKQTITEMNALVQQVSSVGQQQEQSITDVTNVIGEIEKMSKQLRAFTQKL